MRGVPVSGRILSDEEDLCTCGRSGAKAHCPLCGSSNFIARRRSGRMDVDKVSGKPIWIRGFYCRKCGADFAEDLPCAAPPYEKPLSAQHQDMRSFNAAQRRAERASSVHRIPPAELRWMLAKTNANIRAGLEAEGVDINASDADGIAQVEQLLIRSHLRGDAPLDVSTSTQEAMPTEGTRLAGHARGVYTGGVLEELDTPLGSTEPLDESKGGTK